MSPITEFKAKASARRRAVLFAAAALIAGCGGGSGGGTPAVSTPPPPPPPPPVAQSPGSSWFALDASSNPVLLYVSETGTVRSIFEVTAVSQGPTFGAGSIAVTGTDTVSGALQARGIQPSSGSPRPVDIGCSVTGNVQERATLTVNIVCSDANGIVYDEDLTMTPQPDYDSGSSLDAIAGNYTLTFRPETNMLNVTADGTIFGMYDNGHDCTVNGTVSIIDPDYNLLDVEWTMTNCTGPFFDFYEGVVMTGFAMESPNPTRPPGSYYFLLTALDVESIFPISVVYEPS